MCKDILTDIFTAQLNNWETWESSLQKIRRGEKPPEKFNLGTSRRFDGQEWTVTVRNSSEDKRPTLEFYRKGIKGKVSEKRIKLRYGDEP